MTIKEMQIEPCDDPYPADSWKGTSRILFYVGAAGLAVADVDGSNHAACLLAEHPDELLEILDAAHTKLHDGDSGWWVMEGFYQRSEWVNTLDGYDWCLDERYDCIRPATETEIAGCAFPEPSDAT